MPREGHQEGFVLAQQWPDLPDTCNPEETGLPGLPMSHHPPYSPDLALSDYHLFSELKKQLRGRYFSSDGEITAAADTAGRTTI